MSTTSSRSSVWFAVVAHSGYWLLYLLLLATVFGLLGAVAGSPPRLADLLFSRLAWIAVAPNVLAFYGGYVTLFPDQSNPRFGVLAAGGAAVALGSVLVALTPLYLFFPAEPYWREVRELAGLVGGLTVIAYIHLAVSLVLRGFLSWHVERRRAEELARRGLETELALLRSRLDPHFLFNTLNNIDVLISNRPEAASRYLHELSELLRFVLYESSDEAIPLQAELDFLARYVALERIRSSSPDYVALSVEGDPQPYTIRPLVLAPFVENAFKHSNGERVAGAIRIAVEVGDGRLRFQCVNRMAPEPSGDGIGGIGGVGDALIRRRLALTYPGRFRLDVRNRDGEYDLTLDLELDRRAMPGG